MDKVAGVSHGVKIVHVAKAGPEPQLCAQSEASPRDNWGQAQGLCSRQSHTSTKDLVSTFTGQDLESTLPLLGGVRPGDFGRCIIV